MKPFIFIVTVEVERSEGKFASRDELADQIREAIEDANPGEIEGENGGTYTVDNWDINEEST